MKQNLWLSILIVLTFQGCDKSPDYREKFTGSFTFTVESYQWITGVPDNIRYLPTVTYSGTINVYKKGDYNGDLNRFQDEYKYMSKRLTIKFSADYFITPPVNENGTLDEEWAIHYHCNGQFSGYDEVEFFVYDIGSAGQTLNFHVKGKRK
jgi:hypothetical protein